MTIRCDERHPYTTAYSCELPTNHDGPHETKGGVLKWETDPKCGRCGNFMRTPLIGAPICDRCHC